MTVTQQAIVRRDRWADWTVVGLVVVALILGWVLRVVTLTRTEGYADAAAGISVRYPAGWVRETGDDPLLRVRDPLGGQFDTMLELRSRPLAPDTEPALVLDALALERATQVTAYQTLSTDQVLVGGATATRRTFTYVHIERNPYVDQLPVVVQGVDLALPEDGRVLIATLLADAAEFEAQERRFLAFVESLEY